ncbi:Hypothetical predicted protein [Marmota monax]|uniref:Nicotinamide riboside kinase 2 n=1 Tax=Marmota monax TaxID=9995 RepID=A0A5E4BV36_MARMO|nr:Hypothetical predicted protein [Marmota monax]
MTLPPSPRSPMVPGPLASPDPALWSPVLESLDMEAMLSTVRAWLSNPQKFARAHGVNVQPGAPDTHILLLEGFLLYSYKYAPTLFPQGRSASVGGGERQDLSWVLGWDGHQPETLLDLRPPGPAALTGAVSQRPEPRPGQCTCPAVPASSGRKCGKLELCPGVPPREGLSDPGLGPTVAWVWGPGVYLARPLTRTYTVPDAPGLFDGHVWPMYQKYKREMEASGVDVVYLDGTKPREELLREALEDIQNSLLNRG